MLDLNDFIINQENSKSSRKLYKATCNNCGIDRGYKRIGMDRSGFCRSCFSTIKHTGKIVSAETKTKMKINNHLNNGGVHPGLGKSRSKETKAKLSLAAAKQNKNYSKCHDYNGINGHLVMRSSWEVKYAEYLDANNVKWEYEPVFTLSNGYTYVPDFKLEDGTIIEIKGYFRDDSKNKWEMFCEDYPLLKKSLLMKPELKKLGVL